MSPTLALYHFPGACSQVSVAALEETGLDYSVRLVNLARGEQSHSDYLAISPLGKVPVLIIDGAPLTESAAILTCIDSLCPEANLLPVSASPRGRTESVGGLAFCGGSLHPIVRGIANPSRLTTGDGEPVRRKATELAEKAFGYAEHRLAERGWWLGQWSIIDAYLNWAYRVAIGGGFAVDRYPNLVRLLDRLMERPAFARMMAGEAQARSALGLPA